MAHTDQPVVTGLSNAPLLEEYDRISEVKYIASQVEVEGSKGKVFDFVGNRLTHATERQLRKSGRWSEDEALVIHIEIKYIRLRKNAAVFLLWQVAGVDEMGIRIWITRDGEVVASEAVSSIYDAAGGIYGTNTNQRRLAILADQVASKMVKRL
ncbi:hypothetical protein [Mariprofundus sp. KV]|uniref:hypothetical protein n=1 Tax=Mariprofundus sp. KV TaxID=2608715 RepID=UPI0015A16C83|nr:hypothetical protein [Mariprofundus sp. KV]NWF36410.1 hypothetical protein [Mariprofundus sp. KV]